MAGLRAAAARFSKPFMVELVECLHSRVNACLHETMGGGPSLQWPWQYNGTLTVCLCPLECKLVSLLSILYVLRSYSQCLWFEASPACTHSNELGSGGRVTVSQNAGCWGWGSCYARSPFWRINRINISHGWFMTDTPGFLTSAYSCRRR